MKKIGLSLMLIIFVFNMFYPAIYATENMLNNEISEEIAEIEDETEKIEEVDEKKIVKEEENISEKIEEIFDIEEKEEKSDEEQLVDENLEEETIDEFNDKAENVEEKVEETKKEEKVIIKTPEVNTNVGVAHTGKMYIETPTNNAKLLLPDSNTLTVKGWAVSTDKNAVLKIYIDNKYMKNTDKRTKRADVDKAITTFGGTETTPNAGFEASINISTLSVGKHTLKIEQFSQTGAIICSEERNIEISQKSFSGQMYVESPSFTSSYVLPDNKKMQIKGWAVSDDIGAYMLVYIDGKISTYTTTRISRSDVDKLVSPAYGGTEMTPKAGFVLDVELSSVSAGSHEVLVMEVSRYHKIMCRTKLKINVSQKKYDGKMYIETPTNNMQLTLPDSNKLTVKGWAVSTDADATLKLYIDGQFKQNISSRINRVDVNKSVTTYGGITTTPKAGFESVIDVSTLSVGNHTIKIEQTSNLGSVICSDTRTIQIKQAEYKGKMYVESPATTSKYNLPEDGTIQIKGWAVSDDIGAYMLVYINGKQAKFTTTRTSRSDVDKAVSPSYGGTKTTPKAGFILNVDISTLATGSYNVTVMEVSRYHKIMCKSELKISVTTTNYVGKMYVESPSAMASYNLSDEKTMQIKGWAVSNDVGAYMLVYINGKISDYTTTRTVRTDVDKVVSPSYGGTKTTPKAGFTLNVNIGILTDGTYDVRVMEVSRYHKIMCEQQFKIKVSTPVYSGSMYVESPVQNKRYHSGELEIKGWALSEDKNDSIKIYLDGKLAAIAERRARADVLAVYQGKFGGEDANKFPGFYSVLDTSTLVEGIHSVRIVDCSKYGKEIQYAETKFMISNTTTWGIDVSHYQADIDWNAVRNQGINFAILKIGEYRESSGRVIQDSKFEQNYATCKNLGIAVGGYFYSYAFDPTEASHEAAACLSIISGKSFEMPIFLDIEDDLIKNAVKNGTTNASNLTNGAITFCTIMNQNGYQSGVYASKSFFETYLYTPLLENYNIWLAHYTGTTNYSGRYDIWQYTSGGELAGIRGAVDLNWCYRRY